MINLFSMMRSLCCLGDLIDAAISRIDLEEKMNCITFHNFSYFNINPCVECAQCPSIILDRFLQIGLRVGYFFIANDERFDDFA